MGVLRPAMRQLKETWAETHCRGRAELKWWYKLATLPEDRYPKQLFNHVEEGRGKCGVGWWMISLNLI